MGKSKQQTITSRTEDKTTFFYYAFRNILLIGLPLLIVSGFILSHSFSHVLADNPNNGSGSSTDNLSFSISSSCTLSSVVDESHNAELNNGTYVDGIGKTTITTLCNDGNGYSIYANGYSNDEEGNSNLVNVEQPGLSIMTGLATSGTTSNWAMSLNNVVNDTSPTPPVIEDDYDGIYGLVPNEWTKVASLPSSATDMDQGSSFTTTYAVYTSSSQTTGTYNGKVKYMLVHPSYKPAVYFMQDVASWKNLIDMEESVQAVDKRDGKSYWVTKLKDGNIWMTQNLDFDIVADEQDSTKIKTLTSEDTDLADHSLTGAYSGANGYSYDSNTGIVSWTPASTAKTINFEGTTVTGWQNSNTEPYSASKIDGTNTGHTSLGNYYNWTAAVASNNSSTLTSDTINNISQNPQNSICPKGWRLPTISSASAFVSNSTNEFARLNYLYNNNLTNGNVGLISNPLFFTQSGYIGFNSSLGGVLANFLSYGYYWSSTVGGSGSGYNINFNDSSVKPYYDFGVRYNGFPVRCVAR